MSHSPLKTGWACLALLAIALAGCGGGSSARDGGGGTAGGGAGAGGRGGGAGTTAGAGGDGAGGRGGAAGATGGTGGGGAGGTAGQSGVSYSGCTFVGGVNRIVVAKRDTQQNLCVVFVLAQQAPNRFNLTLPQDWGMEFAFAMPAMSECRRLSPPSGSSEAAVGSGTVALPPTPTPTVNIDVTLTFPPTDADFSGSARLMAASVVAPLGCP